mgnify:CR=1 FL=1
MVLAQIVNLKNLKERQPSRLSLLEKDGDIAKINALRPPRPIVADDVLMQGCRLTGNRLNSQGGRFRDVDIPMLAEKTIAAPLMVAHDRESLPVGRFFDGWVLDEGECKYVCNSFYVPSDESGQSLIHRIEMGIISELSISFRCKKLSCSIDGLEIRDRECSHFPGVTYPVGGLCFYWYDEILDVLEGSLVFRGAHPGTGFLGELSDTRPTWLIEKEIRVKQALGGFSAYRVRPYGMGGLYGIGGL